MTISTRRTKHDRSSGRGAFTLVEVMVAAAISSFVLAGILSAFVMIGRTGFVASSYSVLEAETRRALDTFGQDVRKATDVTWNSAQSITLSVATATNATTTITYAYDATAGTATTGCFYRQLGDTASTLPRRILVHNVSADFAFRRYKLESSSNPGADNTATNNAETKQIEVVLRASRTGATTVAANQTALSARYILRNKRVAN
jgi:type II secretory pathway pseudopilin PulG